MQLEQLDAKSEHSEVPGGHAVTLLRYMAAATTAARPVARRRTLVGSVTPHLVLLASSGPTPSPKRNCTMKMKMPPTVKKGGVSTFAAPDAVAVVLVLQLCS